MTYIQGEINLQPLRALRLKVDRTDRHVEFEMRKRLEDRADCSLQTLLASFSLQSDNVAPYMIGMFEV